MLGTQGTAVKGTIYDRHFVFNDKVGYRKSEIGGEIFAKEVGDLLVL